MSMDDGRKNVLTDRLVMPVAAVVSAFLVIAPGIMWASNLTARINAQDQMIAEMKIRLQRSEDDSVRDSTRLTVVETNYATVLTTLGDIKRSLEKIEGKFSER